MVDFTVVIPTYNGAKRLPQVLDRLRSQLGIEQVLWEVIVIDNNSRDETANVVKSYQETWPEAYPLKYYFEPEQGLAYARQRGVNEAKGTFIGFLDDDNLPALNWVTAAVNFGQAYPQAGAFSGQIHGAFEVEPPENYQRIYQFLAIREHGDQPCLFDPKNLRLPPGAGLVIRRQAWCESVPPRLILIGRVGGAMVAGEDSEALLHLYRMGWEIWYNPAMYIEHQIPAWRLERQYLIPLARGCGIATGYLLTINAKNWQKLLILSRLFLGSLRRALRHWLKYGKEVKRDAIAEFELQFFLSSAMSVFYYLKIILFLSKKRLTSDQVQ